MNSKSEGKNTHTFAKVLFKQWNCTYATKPHTSEVHYGIAHCCRVPLLEPLHPRRRTASKRSGRCYCGFVTTMITQILFGVANACEVRVTQNSEQKQHQVEQSGQVDWAGFANSQREASKHARSKQTIKQTKSRRIIVMRSRAIPRIRNEANKQSNKQRAEASSS